MNLKTELELLKDMYRIRFFSEVCKDLTENKNCRNTFHLNMGREALVVGVTSILKLQDMICSTYDEYIYALLKGVRYENVLREVIARSDSCNQKVSNSLLAYVGYEGLLHGSGSVLSSVQQTFELALKYKESNEGRNAVCFFDSEIIDNSLIIKHFSAAMEYHVPILFCCESFKECDLSIESNMADGQDVIDIVSKTKFAFDYINSEKKPYILFFNNLNKYSIDLCPIQLLKNKILKEGLISDSGWKNIQNNVQNEIELAISFIQDDMSDVDSFVSYTMRKNLDNQGELYVS